MLGLGDKNKVDPTKLNVLVHSFQSAEALGLAQKIWETNSRNARVDAANYKELLRFVFSQPPCVVWLQRDQGRSDTFEMVLQWAGIGKEEGITEVYVMSAFAGATIGDDSRAVSLLKSILASPATVPASEQQQQPPA
jgi:hypothetical protein